MNDKKVKIKETPTNKKQSKHVENPGNFKKFNVCWQIGFLDLNGSWGWNSAFNQIKFLFSDQLIAEIGEIDDETFNFLSEIDNKIFISQNDFLEKLMRNTNHSLSPQQVVTLLKYLNRKFFYENIYPKLKEFERLTWLEILTQTNKRERSKHHPIDKNKLHKKAQERLIEF